MGLGSRWSVVETRVFLAVFNTARVLSRFHMFSPKVNVVIFLLFFIYFYTALNSTFQSDNHLISSMSSLTLRSRLD